MHLADYVVSYSLQINNRCLRYLAECDSRGGLMLPGDRAAEPPSEGHAVFAESLLARDSRRLVSLWALMSPEWDAEALDQQHDYQKHVKALRRVSKRLGEANSTRRLALRLAGSAQQDHEAEALLKVARKLPAQTLLTWEAMNDLFALDSQHWRNASGFRGVQDELLTQRIARSYRKSYRLAMLQGTQSNEQWLLKHDRTLRKWSALTSHQLELLRPGLSDKGKAQLWYVEKMADSLRSRAGLLALSDAIGTLKLKKATAKTALAQVAQQRAKMDKRIVRLAKGSFNQKPSRMLQVVEQAVEALGLRDISLMQPPGLISQVQPEHSTAG